MAGGNIKREAVNFVGLQTNLGHETIMSGPGGDGPGVIMRTKLGNLLKAVSSPTHLATGSGPEEVCPGSSGSGHILEIQQESEPTFSLNCVYNGPNYTKIHSHHTSVGINITLALSRV